MRRNSFTIELSSSGQPPTEFRLFAKGYNETTKGIFKFDDAAAQSVMAKAAEVGNDFCIDYDHGMLSFLAVDPAESGKAAGWFTPAIRSGELWATRVSWTPRASRMLSDREYRYCSPAFDLDDDNRITRLINVALTNIPATKNAPPLVLHAGELGAPHPNPSQEKKSMKKALLAALGLASTVDEATALAAVTAKNERIKQLEAKVGVLEQREKETMALAGKESHSEALGVLRAHKVAAETAAQKVADIEGELVKLKSTTVASELEQLIAKGKEDGKIPPALEQWARDTGGKDVAQLKAFLSAAVPMPKPTRQPAPAGGGEVTLSDAEREIAAKMGGDVEARIKEWTDAKRKSIASGAYPFPTA